ncbi:MAG: glycosyltransferase family 8 protein [Ruminococcaceae bacterium]|nr:glycosyltransferase family 8 protein [Oscillospiraceae bacterium]
MINIFTASNDKYYPRLKVFTDSLLKKNRGDFSITVLYSSLSDENIKKYEQFAKKNNFECRFIKADNSRLKGYKLIHQITEETYYRFMFLDIFPDEDRAVWMDIDTVVMDSLKPFYEMDFADNYVIACPGNNEKKHLERLGLDTGGCYFNAGVILFNLKKIRNDFEKNFLFDTYEKNEDKIWFSDQDVMNIAFAGKIKRIDDRKYNYIVMSEQKIDWEKYRDIKKNVAVIHYVRHIKPWQIYFDGKIKYIYLKAMVKSYPFNALFTAIAGELYRFKPNKKTLNNSER